MNSGRVPVAQRKSDENTDTANCLRNPERVAGVTARQLLIYAQNVAKLNLGREKTCECTTFGGNTRTPSARFTESAGFVAHALSGTTAITNCSEKGSGTNSAQHPSGHLAIGS
jgi:hypothetical protein